MRVSWDLQGFSFCLCILASLLKELRKEICILQDLEGVHSGFCFYGLKGIGRYDGSMWDFGFRVS